MLTPDLNDSLAAKQMSGKGKSGLWEWAPPRAPGQSSPSTSPQLSEPAAHFSDYRQLRPSTVRLVSLSITYSHRPHVPRRSREYEDAPAEDSVAIPASLINAADTQSAAAQRARQQVSSSEAPGVEDVVAGDCTAGCSVACTTLAAQ